MSIPPPSTMIEIGDEVVFQYLIRMVPKSWFQFQTIAKCKTIIAKKLSLMGGKVTILDPYEYDDMMKERDLSQYRTYSIKELFKVLGEDMRFQPFVNFRQTFMGSLVMYGRRLVYEDTYSLEKIISTALWHHKSTTGKKPNDAEWKELVKKKSWRVHRLIQDDLENLRTKLDKEEYHRNRVESGAKGGKSNSRKNADKREVAKKMFAEGKKISEIAKTLNVSRPTIYEWKKHF